MQADVFFWHPVAGLIEMPGVEYEPRAGHEWFDTGHNEFPERGHARALPIVRGAIGDLCVRVKLGDRGLLWAVVGGQIADCMTAVFTSVFTDEAGFASTGEFRVTSEEWKH